MKSQILHTRTPMLATLGLVATMALGAASASAYTRSTPNHMDVDASLVDVSILVDGAATPLYFKPGSWDRHYFEAFKGRSYSLVVRNTTNRRVGVLIAVDGLNVVTGGRSNLSRGESMYVLDPWGQATINGWRTSLDEVRRFVFVDEQRSYAERTGQANGDLGWIRVHTFREVEPVAWRPWVAPGDDRERAQEGQKQGARRDGAAAPAPKSEASRDYVQNEKESDELGESNPGTGWGDRRFDPVQHTEFVAANRASDRISFRYEYASGLQALGIFPRVHRTWDRDHGLYGFAPAPRW